MSVNEWRPALFADKFRQTDADPPVTQWEELLQAEQSFTHRVVTAIARRSWLSRLLGVPGHLGSPSGWTLAEREARAHAIADTRLAQIIGRFPRRHDASQSVEEPRPGLPALGPLLDREIDQALELLTTMAFEEVQRRGWHLQPNHTHWPLNDLQFLRANPQLWADPKVPGGIDWDIDGQMEFAKRLSAHAHELADVASGPPERTGDFTWGQGFEGLDAYGYYGLVRELQPARVVEVGIGVSSLVLARALECNEQKCDVTLIDPGPPWHVLGELPESWQVMPSLVQNVDAEVFSKLQAGDIVFYDGSHCVRTASDVNWMLFEVLPLLQPGVWVHIHDLSWPRDYAEEWIFDEGLSWNEQYFVQAFLMHNTSYEVRLASVMLHHHKGPELENLFPTSVGGASSLWLEKC